ncbi:hypothetical protein H4R34_000996 [Dimargaris verticillata]|uniref:EKC/KEOPS complex subunit CGI121 n=1 Tax=Dimargaris verticillata TaxID=2761393 RepID=A0A9W8B681_9FUNG|nr:hypothetical protein H4R34_000996 [Dimargaris verticillata]
MALTLDYPIPGDHSTERVFLSLWRDVSNVAELSAALRSQTANFSFALVDAQVALDSFQLLAAAHRAVQAAAHDQLRTRNIYSEIIYCLSPEIHIAEAYTRYGLSPSTRHVVAVGVGIDPTKFDQEVQATIEGTQVPMAGLGKFTNIALVRQYYKVPESIQSHDPLVNAVVGSIALKGYK